MRTNTERDTGGGSRREPGELFHEHLDILVHLMRDELQSRESMGSKGPGSPVLTLLYRQRRRLLAQQGGELAREARFRVMGDRLVSRLEEELGVESQDAVAIGWFYRTEIEAGSRARGSRWRRGARSEVAAAWTDGSGNGESAGGLDSTVEEHMDAVGAAHARLLDGVDPFLPAPRRRRPSGFPMAVAVAATRVARRQHGQTTWMEVEPLAREILQLLLSGGRDRAVS